MTLSPASLPPHSHNTIQLSSYTHPPYITQKKEMVTVCLDLNQTCLKSRNTIHIHIDSDNDSTDTCIQHYVQRTHPYLVITSDIPLRQIEAIERGKTKAINFLPTLKPDDKPLVYVAFSRALRDAAIVVDDEHRIFPSVRPDPEGRQATISCVPCSAKSYRDFGSTTYRF